MVEEIARDFSEYLKLDLTSQIKPVQELIDNMLTRLEELTSVMYMIKSRNSECHTSVTDDITKYRSEVTMLGKKITTLIEVISKLENNVNCLEKHVEKAEADFGVNLDNRFKTFLKPFFKKETASSTLPSGPMQFESVMDNFIDQAE